LPQMTGGQNQQLWGVALVNGEFATLAEASLALTDEGVARGDGAFETMGVWDGLPFRLDDHLDRLAASLEALSLPHPDRDLLGKEIAELLDGFGARDGAVRVFVTASGTRVVTLTDPPVRIHPRRLEPQPAPWVRPLGTYGPAGAKAMSYGPNMAATRAAKAAGADDALLVSLEGYVLEGPTFCVLWVRDRVLYTPTVELGLVDSISRRTLAALAREQGLEVDEGRYPLETLADAAEVFICSSVRPVVPIMAVGEYTYAEDTPVRDALNQALEERRRGLR
jgi:branched-subunit amino acid aminotransferase/4-amino-4-deoxychorismate lyase